jgi:hypothetical protein
MKILQQNAKQKVSGFIYILSKLFQFKCFTNTLKQRLNFNWKFSVKFSIEFSLARQRCEQTSLCLLRRYLVEIIIIYEIFLYKKWKIRGDTLQGNKIINKHIILFPHEYISNPLWRTIFHRCMHAIYNYICLMSNTSVWNLMRNHDWSIWKQLRDCERL